MGECGVRSANWYAICQISGMCFNYYGPWCFGSLAARRLISSYFSHMKDKKYSVAYVTNKFIHLGLTAREVEGGGCGQVYSI